MSWPEIEAAQKETRTVILPLGVTEQHGYHLPLSTDTLNAYELAKGIGIRTGAVVEYLDKPRCFAWRCGLRFVLELEERFELEGDDGGARLTHSLTMKGALAYLFVSFLRARLHDLLVETDGRFAGYLRWRFAHPVRSGADRSGLARRYKGRGR